MYSGIWDRSGASLRIDRDKLTCVRAEPGRISVVHAAQHSLHNPDDVGKDVLPGSTHTHSPAMQPDVHLQASRRFPMTGNLPHPDHQRLRVVVIWDLEDPLLLYLSLHFQCEIPLLECWRSSEVMRIHIASVALRDVLRRTYSDAQVLQLRT